MSVGGTAFQVSLYFPWASLRIFLNRLWFLGCDTFALIVTLFRPFSTLFFRKDIAFAINVLYRFKCGKIFV